MPTAAENHTDVAVVSLLPQPCEEPSSCSAYETSSDAISARRREGHTYVYVQKKILIPLAEGVPTAESEPLGGVPLCLRTSQRDRGDVAREP